jgi:multidrug efflux pump
MFLGGAVLASITLGAAEIERAARKIKAGYRRTPFGWFIKLIAGNPIMPLVTIVAVIGFVMPVFGYFGENNRGVEFFVESEPEQAIVYVRARGNLSLPEKDALVPQVEDVVLAHPASTRLCLCRRRRAQPNTGGAGGPLDTIGQVQIELVPWEDRPTVERRLGRDPLRHDRDRRRIRRRFRARQLEERGWPDPGHRDRDPQPQPQGPAQGKPVHLRSRATTGTTSWQATARIGARKFEHTPGLIEIEDTRPLPGIDWQIDVDVEKAAATAPTWPPWAAMVQLVTRGILLDTMRVDSSDEEIEIRVRLPEEDRVLSTLDTLKVRTPTGWCRCRTSSPAQPVPKAGPDRPGRPEALLRRQGDVAAGLSSGR